MVQQRAEVKEVLCKAFGNGILLCDGTLDRKALAKAAFSSKAQTELLNKTILPFILSEIENIIANTKEEYILLDAPTLFEGGADNLCNVAIGVIANREVRYNRIVARDNLTHDRAESRINAGKPDEFYKEKC
jgi:dephospho-CoA kinase